jgi:hypothetical protein
MEFTVSESKFGAPVGVYKAKFVGCKSPNKPHPEFGEGVAWAFEIVGGEHAGRVVERMTSKSPTAKNSCGKMLAGLLGSLPAAGAKVTINDCIGRVYQIVLEPSSTGKSTRVSSILPASS